jgi:hypothetical protein
VKGRLALVNAVLVAAACSTYGSAASDGDGGTGVNGDASPGDDAATGDSATGGDGAADAGPLACPDGGFCDSFERIDLLGLGLWSDEIGDTTPCPATIDPTIASAGDASLRVDLLAVDAGECHHAVERNFPGTPARITLAFDMRLAAIPDRSVNIMPFTMGKKYLYFLYEPRADALYFAEQEDPEDAGASFFMEYKAGAIASGSFHHVALDYTFATRKVLVDLDGVRVIDTTGAQTYSGSSYTLAAGISHSGYGSAVDFWFDDYRFTAE